MLETRDTPRLNRLRHISLLVHRYVGLAMALFLVVAGLTGSMMAFYPQLDAMLNPELLAAKRPADGRPPLDPFVLREKLLSQLPPKQAEELHGVALHIDPDYATNYWVDGKEIFVDPYTGNVNGSRTFGSLREGRKSILTFFYELHFTLGLGDVGHVLFGIVAILWTLDCFVGAYLTFPAPLRNGKGPGHKSWLARWLPAWALKTSKLFSLIFSWHRATGLWFWAMFLVFAWSGVALNMRPVYEAVMGLAFDKAEELEPPKLETPRTEPKISLPEARERAKLLMAAEARKRGFTVIKEAYMDYEPEHGHYTYAVESSLDTSERMPETWLTLDGDTGAQLTFHTSTGEAAGDTISAWLIALHFGAIRALGLYYRSFVCALGVVVTLLSISGVWIWWKKRAGRIRKLSSVTRLSTR